MVPITSCLPSPALPCPALHMAAFCYLLHKCAHWLRAIDHFLCLDIPQPMTSSSVHVLLFTRSQPTHGWGRPLWPPWQVTSCLVPSDVHALLTALLTAVLSPHEATGSTTGSSVLSRPRCPAQCLGDMSSNNRFNTECPINLWFYE